jgi:hypothetical protein
MRHLSCFAAVAALAVPQPSDAQLDAAGLDRLPLAPASQRVDLVAPPFSNSTAVTNPFFPISNLRSAVLNGHVDGEPLKIETTLLPDTRVIEWSPGRCVRTLVSQFVAYKAGRIQEVALDFYAQADDGSVWYFGEDVFNYRRGVVADTSGSWLAGKEGPAAMIMPAHPAPGMVYRPENIPGLVFEEVTVKSVGSRLVAGELHDDGSREEKVFAPGYGEFRSSDDTDLEAMALAVPIDAGRRGVPPRLAAAMRRARRSGDRFAIADARLDLQLQHRPPEEIDRERFALWTRRARRDVRAHRLAALRGDAAKLTWIRDRIARSLDPIALVRVDRRLGELEAAAADGELRAAARSARKLGNIRLRGASS